MKDRENLILLVSYPKSGSTWVRAFLTNLLFPQDGPASINDLMPKYLASNKLLIEDLLGVEISELTLDEQERLRPLVYAHLANTRPNQIFMKVHDQNFEIPGVGPLFKKSWISKIVYIVRNPVDIVPSWANHQNCSIDRAIDDLLDPQFSIGETESGFNHRLRERIGAWNDHVSSWTKLKPTCTHVVKYEDLLKKPERTFGQLVESLGIQSDEVQIARAIQYSSFSVLSQQEAQHSFKEKNPASEAFFRKGQSGLGCKELSEAQLARLTSAFHETMDQFGYQIS